MDQAHTPELARFRILSRLGGGAQGAVYEALDLERNVHVALKTLRFSRPEQVVRFKHEFRAIRDLRHPNLVHLGELSEQNGVWFFTMEIVRGSDFLGWIRGADATLGEATAATTATVRDYEEATLVVRPAALGERRSVAVPLPPAAFDETRLRRALAELVGALHVIHRAGKVHRDLKPSNVLIDHDGRAVLIDFGVVAEVVDQRSDEGLLIGTTAYMAPEQVRTERVGPAADWYALGCLLYHSLTGRPPFSGPTNEVLRLKCSVDPVPPSVFVSAVPRDLEALCLMLLRREATSRPGPREILAALGVGGGEHGVDSTGPDRASVAFVGRAAEVAALDDAYAVTRADRAVAVLLEGESGVGKSALAAHFVEQLAEREPALVVLRGRCHEQERVPYNAFDALIDDLQRVLVCVPEPGLTALLPPGTAELRRLFPALSAVPAIAALGADVEPLPDRAVGVRALRELLVRFARHWPTVMIIDDLQWADADSQEILGDLFREPGAPPLMLLATARSSVDAGPCAATRAIGCELRRIVVGGLPHAEADDLLQNLLRQHPAVRTVDAPALLAEARGHPLFLGELVRHLANQSTESPAAALDDAIFARVSCFAEPARELLRVVATAGAPIPQLVAAEVAGLSAAAHSEHAEALRAAQLVRISGGRPSDTIEPFHDRVRESIYDRMSARDRTILHGRLAVTLDANGAGPDVVFGHLEKAGERQQAAKKAEEAAVAAARMLAFDRACTLYRGALELGRHTPDEQRRLLAALGDALTNAGRAGEAAETFLAAATTGAAEPLERTEFVRRAAEQFLMGGHLEPGLAASNLLLAELGTTLPQRRTGALSRLLWSQTRLRLHPLTWRRRLEPEIDRDALARVDTYWSVGAGLSMVDSVRGMLFVLGGALLALEVGEEARVGRALCAASIAYSGLGNRRQASRLIEAARRDAESYGNERVRFYALMAQSAYAFLIENDWRASLDGIAQAQASWRASGRTEGWESDVAEQFTCWSLENMGRIRELDERVPARIRAAQRAGNRFVEVSFRSYFASVHLRRDRPAEARADVEDAIGSWLPSSDDFGNQQFLALRSLTWIALYAGDVEAVGDALERRWQRFFSSLSRYVELLLQDALMLLAGLSLARAANARRRGDRAATRAHLRAAHKRVQRLARIRLPMAQESTLRLRAGLAACADEPEAAARWLREALARTARAESSLQVAAIRRRLGAVLGGSEGGALRADGDAWLAAEGFVDADRMTAAILPGWPD
jgi:hypothetical protein